MGLTSHSSSGVMTPLRPGVKWNPTVETSNEINWRATARPSPAAHVVTRADPLGRQVVCQPIGASLHLGVGEPSVTRRQVLTLAERVDRRLEEVCEVELHRHKLEQVPVGA